MAIRAMKQSAMKQKSKSKVARGKNARKQVYWGENGKEVTAGGLKKEDLIVNKQGKIVCKKVSENSKKNYKYIYMWSFCFKMAKIQLGLRGFHACKKGTPLYRTTESFYKSTKYYKDRHPEESSTPAAPQGVIHYE